MFSFQVNEKNIETVDTEIPLLPLQMTWLHTCVAISCGHTNHISAVVNGLTVLTKKPFARPESTRCPTGLVGNLVLQKGFVGSGYWFQNQGRVTNVNVFSGLMTQDKMVSRTSGEDCGKQDGDLLSWKNSSWSLQGTAMWTEVSVEDVCIKFASIQVFTTQALNEYQTSTTAEHCQRLCKRMHKTGQMASVDTADQFKKLKDRLRMVSTVLNQNDIFVWLPLQRENGIWLNSYTKERISSTDWNPGMPVDGSNRDCAMYGVQMEGFNNFQCTYDLGLYCSCDFTEH